MERKDKKMLISTAVFYGSLWGIAEAVLGYILHLLPFGLTGFFMFPIGFYFMHKGYRQTQRMGTVFYIGAIAAVIKLTNLFLPFSPAIKVINPAISIMFEALMVVAALKLYSKAGNRMQFRTAVFACGYRVLFVAYISVLALFSIPVDLFKGGAERVIRFVFLEGAINAGIIYAYMKYAYMKGESMGRLPKLSPRLLLKPQYSTLASIVAFIAALAVNGLFAII